MALTSGTKLGPYEILAPVGAGGMGEVYRARDAALGRDVAIKVLPTAFSEDADRLRRFKQEAQAAAALNHPNILAIYHVGQQDQTSYIVSELLEGESLRQRLRSGPLSVRKTIEYGAQVARGLSAAHDKGIVHRDLKPENIFVTRDGRVKILDFGLAKLTRTEDNATESDSPTMTRGSEPGVALGTVGYMSPEQVRGQTAGPASDLFSFGAILYEMLAGKRAFRGETAAETMTGILREDPPGLTETNRQIPPALDRIVRHCLEKNPEERFQSARDVAFDLEALSGSSASTPTVVSPVRARLRSRSLLAAQFLLLALVGIAGLLIGHELGKKPVPSFQRLTFQRGVLYSARFGPDDQTVVYSAAWDGGPVLLFSTGLNSPESRAFDVPNVALSAVSSSGEMATLSGNPHRTMFDNLHGTLARMPPGGGAPREILEDVEWADWAPDGARLAVVHVIGARRRLEFPIGKVLYETSGWISHPRVSPKGDRIAFLDHPALADYHGWVATVDLTGKRSVLSTVSSYLVGLAWSPTGKEIWFTTAKQAGGSALFAVTLSGKERVVARIPGGLRIHDISRDGKVLLTRDDFRTETHGLISGQPKETDFSWRDNSWVDDLSPDGKLLLFHEEGEGAGPNFSSYLMSTKGTAPVHLGEGDGAALSPNGKWVISVLPVPPSQLLLLPTGAGEPKPLERYGLQQHDTADWVPDGKRIVFTAAEPGHGIRIYLQDLQGGNPKPITPEGVIFPWPSHPVSIDGKYLIASDADGKLFVYPLEGGQPRVLPGTEPDDFPIRWSSDGHSIFVHRLSLSSQIYKLDVDTGRRTLTRGLGIDAWPIQITPDGRSYAYNYEETLSDLYLVQGLK